MSRRRPLEPALVVHARAEVPARRRGRWGGALLVAAMPGLTVANAGVGLLLPALLGPIAFGHYALVVTLFQYGLIFDLGLSQLADRSIPVLLGQADRDGLARFIGQTLWLRLYIAAGALLAGGALLAALSRAGLLIFDLPPALLSLIAGIAFMLALGPASVYRARSDRRAFGLISIAANLILAIGRPVGVLAGGVAGCFACLTFGYVALAGLSHAAMVPRAADRPGFAAGCVLIGRGVPLFLTSSVWAFYMTANRWVVSGVAPDLAVGQFAFASNAIYLIVGAIGALSQFYYPRITARFAAIARGAPPTRDALSRDVTRDLSLLAGASAALALAGIVLAPPLIGLCYPKFAASAPAVQMLLLALPSLVVSTWLMPIALSVARRPWVDGVFVYPTALAILLALTYAGYRLDGIAGAGAGLAVSAPILLLLQLAHFHLAALLRPRHALVLLATVAGMTALLGAALWLEPDGVSGITHLWAGPAGHRQ